MFENVRQATLNLTDFGKMKCEQCICWRNGILACFYTKKDIEFALKQHNVIASTFWKYIQRNWNFEVERLIKKTHSKCNTLLCELLSKFTTRKPYMELPGSVMQMLKLIYLKIMHYGNNIALCMEPHKNMSLLIDNV